MFADDRDGRRTPSLRTVLRNAKLIYFSVPKITLGRLAELKGPALAALLSLVKYAGELREPDFVINVQQWRKMSGIAGNETLLAACANFEDTVKIYFKSGAHHATAWLLNPETGRDITDEQFEKELSAAKRPERESPYTREELERWFRNEFPDAIPNGSDLIIHCPRCREIHPTKTRPTLRYDAGKGFWGVFYCDECRYGKGATPVHLTGRDQTYRPTTSTAGDRKVYRTNQKQSRRQYERERKSRRRARPHHENPSAFSGLRCVCR